MRYSKQICRIEKKFRDLKLSNKSALITFITAGDPNLNYSKEVLLNLPKAGADIIEIGVPLVIQWRMVQLYKRVISELLKMELPWTRYCTS